MLFLGPTLTICGSASFGLTTTVGWVCYTRTKPDRPHETTLPPPVPVVAPPTLLVVECESYVVRQRRDKLVLEIRGVRAVPGLPPHRDYLTPNQMCDRLGISLRTLEKQRKQQHPIPVTYVGKVPRFVEEEVAEWAEKGQSLAARRARGKFRTSSTPEDTSLIFAGTGRRRKKLPKDATTLPHGHA